MISLGRVITVICVLSAMHAVQAGARAQGPIRYDPVEQFIADRNPLSTSLRRLHLGIARPTGFQDVFRVPGEEGKLMRVHGSVQAVFSESLYAFDEDDEIEAVIPPNTVFRIGPRVQPGSSPVSSLLEGHPGMVAGVHLRRDEAASSGDAHRVVPEGFGRVAIAPQSRPRPVSQSREAAPALIAQRGAENDVELPEEIDVPGTIIGDEQYRRQRLHALMNRAAAGE